MKQSFHFPKQLQERIGLTWDELISKYDHEVVLAGEPTKHRIVQKKKNRYPHQDFIVFKDANLFCARGADGTLVTAMYLDGRWGYKNRPYDADEHFGKKLCIPVKNEQLLFNTEELPEMEVINLYVTAEAEHNRVQTVPRTARSLA